MIIGHGDIASAIIDRPGFCFFARGVSDSSETRIDAFIREHTWLKAQPKTIRLVYFSSLCVLYSDSPYAQHKMRMEIKVRGLFPNWTIIRLGNITWGSNPHTLINYLRAHPDAPIRDEWRYIVDKDEFQHWLGLIPPWNCEMNIPGRRMKVADIYQEFVTDAIQHA